MTAGIAALLLSVTSVYAQQVGTVSGQVVDNSTGKYLEGAEVSVNDLRTTTERDGKFTLRNVPEGAQKLVVNYPGLDTNETSVDVKAGQTADVAVKMMTQEIITLGEFKVEGTKEGMAQAVALQKVSIESKLIAANDQFGTISEGNIGEYLKFLPGVGIVYNSNDARGIALRGMRSQFTTVAVDGTPMASASSSADSRRFETEQVSATNVEKNEIIKTMSADMPANSTGGYVNMVTKSAFDRQDAQRFEYRVYLTAPSTAASFSKQSGKWGNGDQYTVRPNFNVNFAKRVNEKFGFNINYQFAEVYHDSPRTSFAWLPYQPSGTTVVGNALSVADPTLQTYTQTNEQKLTHREALASKIDYKISDSTTLTFSGQWNWYDLTFQQRANIYNFGTAGVITNLPGIESSQASTSGRSIQTSPSQRNKYVTGLHFNTTLTHEFSDTSKAWLTAYWSQADGKYRDTTKGYVANVAANYTTTNPIFTVNNVQNNPDHPWVGFNDGTTMSQVLDIRNYTLQNGTNMRSRPESALDTKDGVQAHYKYSLNTSIPVTLQTGAAFDEVGRTIRRQEFRAGSFTTALPALTGQALANNLGSDYIYDYGFDYGQGQVLDLYKTYQQYGSLLGNSNTTWSDNYRRFEESNIAGYVRADATFMKNLLVVGGIRWEKREIDGTANNKALAKGSYSKTVSNNITYDNWYPSISVRYTPTRSWVVRAGASRTVGDPDYSEIIPNFTAASNATLSDATLTAPGADLKPYYVNNYDISVEYYFSKSGVIGGSIYRKDVDGFIINKTVARDSAEGQQMLAENGLTNADFENTAANSTLTKKVNGLGSRITGFEIWYNQNLTFLPKPFDGLNFQTNFSCSDIDGDDLATTYAQYTDAVVKAINAQLSYRWRKLSILVSTNWTDEVLGSVASVSAGGINYFNTYKAPEIKTKIAINYSFNQHYNAFFEIDNIGYKRQDNFKAYRPEDVGIQYRSNYYVYGDPVVRLGVKGAF
jgi:TonB-dependent receptor